jgi:hypothetical protein
MEKQTKEQDPLDEIFLTEKETRLYNQLKIQFENRTEQKDKWLKTLENSHKRDLKTIWRLRQRLVLMNNCLKKSRTQAISEFKEKVMEIAYFLEDNGYMTFWIKDGKDGAKALEEKLSKTAQEIK